MRSKNTKMSNTDIIWSRKLISIIDKSFAYSTWPNFQKEFANSTPFTLCHGDFHAANMINKQDNTIILLDWSEVGIWSPMTDIGQLFISDIKPNVRRSNEVQLIKHYWHQLIQNGVSAGEYPFEECWKSYESSPIERWIWMFAYLSGLDLPAKAIQYFHDQLLSFIEDHSDRPYYILKPVSVVG
jgi:aminoglycoside phosphotransferase (APT) family kinase protein